VDPPDTSWISISAGTSGSDYDTIFVNYQANNREERTGKIIVSSTGVANSPDTVELIQALPVDLVLQNITIDTGQTEVYKASNSITAAGDSTYFIVESSDSTAGNATFVAGYKIMLNQGFDAKPGSLFEANIDTNMNKGKAEAEAKAEVDDSHVQMTILPKMDTDGIFILSLNIEEKENVFVQVLDENDMLVYKEKYMGAETHIDLSAQPKGIYTVNIWWSDQRFVEEIKIK